MLGSSFVCRPLHIRLRAVRNQAASIKKKNSRETYFNNLPSTSISESRRPSALTELNILKSNKIEEMYQKLWFFEECGMRELSTWRTVSFSGICAIDTAKVDDVVSRTRNDRLFGNWPAWKVVRYFKKLKRLSEDEESPFHMTHVGDMMTSTVDTLESGP